MRRRTASQRYLPSKINLAPRRLLPASWVINWDGLGNTGVQVMPRTLNYSAVWGCCCRCCAYKLAATAAVTVAALLLLSKLPAALHWLRVSVPNVGSAAAVPPLPRSSHGTLGTDPRTPGCPLTRLCSYFSNKSVGDGQIRQQRGDRAAW